MATGYVFPGYPGRDVTLEKDRIPVQTVSCGPLSGTEVGARAHDRALCHPPAFLLIWFGVWGLGFGFWGLGLGLRF